MSSLRGANQYLLACDKPMMMASQSYSDNGPVQPGMVIDGRYEIEELIRQGGMGSVYRARDRDGGTVALKILNSRMQQLRERFDRETQILCQLHHPTIVRYLDSGLTPMGQRYLVMEWLKGIDLRDRIDGPSLPLGDVLELIGRVATALGVAHDRGVIHRDVKPENIFLPDSDVSATKLLDFGIARWNNAPRALTAAGKPFGTPGYMAPEQVRGEVQIDPCADVFSLGCVFFECLTGQPAFVAHSPVAIFCKILFEKVPCASDVTPGVPVEVEALLQDMLAKDPNGRPRDGNQVAAAIDHLSHSLAASSLRPRLHRRPSRRTLTESEQRWVNVVVATIGPQTRVPAVAAQASTLPFATTPMEPVLVQPPRVNLDAIVSRMEGLGARANRLGDGTLVAVFESSPAPNRYQGTAIDQAANAARSALTLRREFTHARVAMATERATMSNQRLVGEAIDRAVALLGPEKASRRSYQWNGVRTDKVTAGLLQTRFAVVEDASAGFLLRGERQFDDERTLLGKPTPFVGRRRELQTMLATLDECLEEPTARVILVTGAVGFGKTRLRQEFLRRLSEYEQDIAVWIARGDTMRAGSPLGLISQAIRRHAGIVDGEPLAARQQKLWDCVARHVPREHVRRVALFIGELLKVPATDEADVQLRAARRDPVLMSDQVRRACIDLLTAEVGHQPIVFLIEDLHWGDRPSVELLNAALRSLEECPFLLLAFGRPETHTMFPRTWSEHNVTELSLGRLPRNAAARLVRAVLGPDLDPKRVARLVEHADGNPFYLEELVRNAAVKRWELPETVLAMVEARLAMLAPRARQILRAASVFGGVFWRGGIAALLGNFAALDEWLRVLVDQELIAVARVSRFPDQVEYEFRHALIREGAYDMLTKTDRVLGHRLAGEWLQGAGETDGRVLAEQFERGGLPERAVPHYARAAADALDRSDFKSALALAERGIQCGAKGPMLGLLKRVQIEEHIWRRNTAAVARLCAECMELMPRGSRAWYDIVGEAALAWGRLGEVDRVEMLAEMLRGDTAPGDDRVGHDIAMAKLALQFFLFGRIERGEQLLAELEAKLGDLDGADPIVAANVHFTRSMRANIALGDPAQALREFERCAVRFEEIGDLRQACLQRANVGYVKAELGLYSEAEIDLRAAMAIAERMALDLAVNMARQTLGVTLARQGRLIEAEQLIRTAIDWFIEQGDVRMIGWCRIDLATILLLADDPEAAGAEIELALELLPESSLLRPLGLATLSRVLLARGQVTPALDAATQAVTTLDRQGAVESGEAVVRLSYAEALAASGDRDAARDVVEQARDYLLERAGKIAPSKWRRSFLQNITEHERSLALAQRWSKAS